MALTVIEWQKEWREMIQCAGGIKRRAQGASLDRQHTFPLLVEVAKRDSLFHKGADQRSFSCLFAAANVSNYTRKKAHVMAFTLKHLRSLHQQLAVRRIGRWLGPDEVGDYWDVFEDLSGVAAVKDV